MNRTAATRRTATRTSDRTFCFFRSLSQSSVSFGFRQAFLDLIQKRFQAVGENCLDSSAAVVRDGVPARLAWKTSGIPQVRGTPDVNFAYVQILTPDISHRTSLNYFWAKTTAGLAMALLASSFSTRVIGNWRPLFSPSTQIWYRK
jgi:hypothetical protein